MMSFSGKPLWLLLLLLTLSLGTFFNSFRHRLQLSSSLSSDPTSQTKLDYRKSFLSNTSSLTIAAHLHHLTVQPHLAGTPASLSTAFYVQSYFKSLGLTTYLTNFSSLLSYPKYSSLSAHFSNGTIFSVPLSEPNVPQNGVIMPYHAFSPSGSIYAPVVFLNYGREQDYRALSMMRVEFKGCIGLVRRGPDMSRYEVVANAAGHGVAAVLMYTEGDYKQGVERGTVMNSIGDPLTPGWASVESGEKLEAEDSRVLEKFPSVPSLPVSESAAESILMSLEGPKMPYESGDSKTWRVGPGPTMLDFTYKGEQKITNIHNVFAVIKGSEEPDRVVLLGNHRDAWTYGGVDPSSGTSVLLDIARRYALLMQSGWNPRRTIVLCSWDAEEFGMIGSTEWVELNLVNLGTKAVAYLNVDCASQGPGFFASTTPQLDALLIDVTKKVADPDAENGSLYEKWIADNKGANFGRLSRVDSDFAPFLQHAGVPSVDLYFGRDFPVYHTAFDSYDWMKNFGDPLFKRHIAVAGVLGLVALYLADDPVLPFNYISYASELLNYKNVLSTLLQGDISLNPIAVAIHDFAIAANETEEEAQKLRMDGNFGDLRRRMLNDRLMLAERGFLDSEGLAGRQWFKHLIYGPRGNMENKMSFFPGIGDAISQKNIDEKQRHTRIRHEIWRVARAIQRAASALRGELT